MLHFYIFNNGIIAKEGFSGSDRRALEWSQLFVQAGHAMTLIVPKVGVDRYSHIGMGTNLLVTTSVGGERKRWYFLTYLWRAVRACGLDLPVPQGTPVLYSVSDLLADIVPAFYWKLKWRNAKWIAGLHLIAPFPFKGFERHYSRGVHWPGFRDWYYFLAQRLFMVLMRHWAALVLVSNPLDKKWLIERGFRPERVLVTPGAPNWAEIQAASQGPKVYDACFIGRYHPQKGLDDLLEAWRRVVESRPEARLVMIGEVLELRDRVAQMGLTANVEFRGIVIGVPKYELIKSSKVCLFPSRYESFGMVVVEAIACGVPVIAYDLPVFRVLYLTGMRRVPVGDVTSFSQHVVHLLEDDTERARLGAAASQTAQTFSWEQSATDIVEALTA